MRRVFSLYQSHSPRLNPRNITDFINPRLPLLSSKLRFFSSSQNDDSTPKPEHESDLGPPEKKQVALDVQDVDNKELKQRLDEYFKKGEEQALPSIFEAILGRSLTEKHHDTDDELIDELQMQPLDEVNDQEFESDLEEIHETDEEVEDLYNARDIVTKRMNKDEYFNMDDKKWDEMVKEGMQHGCIKDTRECEAILEDMMNWDKLLPDEIKKKVEAKFEEIAARVESGELNDEEGHALFKEFEDQMVIECAKLMEAEAPECDETSAPDDKKDLDDPPGEGPILRWQSRIVFAPGGDAWHPKNRKVKLAVTVQELGLSKHQARRLRELAGKRYNSGKDELTITSERYENREENRKDCLRTLFALIEECAKASDLVEDARTSYMKEKLKSNPEFMKRLNGKMVTRELSEAHVWKNHL